MQTSTFGRLGTSVVASFPGFRFGRLIMSVHVLISLQYVLWSLWFPLLFQCVYIELLSFLVSNVDKDVTILRPYVELLAFTSLLHGEELQRFGFKGH